VLLGRAFRTKSDGEQARWQTTSFTP